MHVSMYVYIYTHKCTHIACLVKIDLCEECFIKFLLKEWRLNLTSNCLKQAQHKFLCLYTYIYVYTNSFKEI